MSNIQLISALSESASPLSPCSLQKLKKKALDPDSYLFHAQRFAVTTEDDTHMGPFRDLPESSRSRIMTLLLLYVALCPG
jgi:hypothetical protein